MIEIHDNSNGYNIQDFDRKGSDEKKNVVLCLWRFWFFTGVKFIFIYIVWAVFPIKLTYYIYFMYTCINLFNIVIKTVFILLNSLPLLLLVLLFIGNYSFSRVCLFYYLPKSIQPRLYICCWALSVCVRVCMFTHILILPIFYFSYFLYFFFFC